MIKFPYKQNFLPYGEIWKVTFTQAIQMYNILLKITKLRSRLMLHRTCSSLIPFQTETLLHGFKEQVLNEMEECYF